MARFGLDFDSNSSVVSFRTGRRADWSCFMRDIVQHVLRERMLRAQPERFTKLRSGFGKAPAPCERHAIIKMGVHEIRLEARGLRELGKGVRVVFEPGQRVSKFEMDFSQVGAL